MQIPGSLTPVPTTLRSLLAGLDAPRPAGSPEADPPSAQQAASDPPADAARETTLWDVLTPEERAFFEERTAAGTWTYGRSGSRADDPQGPTGSRIDVRG